jgi:S1-C subfamily serine protease
LEEGSGTRVRASCRQTAWGQFIAVVATAVCVAGCAWSGGDEPSRGTPAQRSEPPGPEARLDLAVVRLDARIGNVRQRSAGVVVDAGRGLILTTAHTLWGAHSLKVATGLGVLHGRILARDPCDDLAVVETQPRIPGLVAVPKSDGGALAGRPVQSAFRGGSATLTTQRVSVADDPAGALADGLAPDGGLRLDGRLPDDASGAPLLGGDGRLAGLATVFVHPGRARRAALPWSMIDERLGELRDGGRAVYVGWSRYYRCAAALHAYATATYPGFRRTDAVLNAAVPATRLPGTGGLD